MLINTRRGETTEYTILPQIFCNYVSEKFYLSYDFYFRTKQNHAHTRTAANKEKNMYVGRFSFIRSFKEKPENEENRGIALFFTLV